MKILKTKLLIVLFLSLNLLISASAFGQEREKWLMFAYANPNSSEYEGDHFYSSDSFRESSINGWKVYFPYVGFGNFEITANYTESVSSSASGSYTTTDYQVNEKFLISTIHYPVVYVPDFKSNIKPFFGWNPQYVYSIDAERTYNGETKDLNVVSDAVIADLLLNFDFGIVFFESLTTFVSWQQVHVRMPNLENDSSSRFFTIVSTGLGIIF